MALTDIVRMAATTHSTTGSYSAGGLGAPANPTYAYDANAATAFGNAQEHGVGGDWGWTIYLISTHHFANPITIESIVYKLCAFGWSLNNPNGSYWLNVQISADNGAGWATIASTSGGIPGNYAWLDATATGPWSAITDIRVQVYCQVGGDREGGTGAWIYEIQAWGQVYNDIGVRMYGVTPGTEPLVDSGAGAHKLRVRKGATTYGIPLVATNDSHASALRIYDGSAVKAIPIANN